MQAHNHHRISDNLQMTSTCKRRVRGCLPFSQKIRKFRFKVKWKGNFPENPFENCGLPPEVVLFFRSERNVGNFLTICFNFPFPGPSRGFSRSSIWQFNGKRNFFRLVSIFGKSLTIMQIMQWSHQPDFSLKW